MPKIIDIFKNDNVDIVIFVLCDNVSSNSWFSSKNFEENNLICSTISIIDEITKKLNIKRYLSVPYELATGRL